MGGVGIPACTEADPPSAVNRITHACKNITLVSTSLRPVIIGWRFPSGVVVPLGNPRPTTGSSRLGTHEIRNMKSIISLTMLFTC